MNVLHTYFTGLQANATTVSCFSSVRASRVNTRSSGCLVSIDRRFASVFGLRNGTSCSKHSVPFRSAKPVDEVNQYGIMHIDRYEVDWNEHFQWKKKVYLMKLFACMAEKNTSVCVRERAEIGERICNY